MMARRDSRLPNAPRPVTPIPAGTPDLISFIRRESKREQAVIAILYAAAAAGIVIAFIATR